MSTEAVAVRPAGQPQTRARRSGAGAALLVLGTRIVAPVRRQIELSNQRSSLARTSTCRSRGRETGCRC